MWADQQNAEGAAIRVTGPAEARGLIEDIGATMAALEKILTVETEHVRVGRISDGLANESRKSELTSAYLRGLEALKANAVALARFAPAPLEELRARHAEFARAIEANQIVLATARAVSENLVKGISNELSRAQAPQGYAPGRAQSAYGSKSAPLLVSREF
ncbi:MAG: hypothetical protein ACXIVD_07665 [Salinarimonas sp.]|jgi:hypothetical protein